ncbi:hypothetical protein HPB48_019926 [Haemaphysalis longicornis]|uniref:Uncharacterized protein n=1 Tax=Haemaphysalis longicornis TaxID=44386 RepID=A0A9J6FKX9_HAELO|nr:hypothetical protein HPB48_019926 [Haemaphysalis longicornis]
MPDFCLDDDIHLHEVTAAQVKLRRNTAPGTNQITNKALTNLATISFFELTDFLNPTWQTGVPQADGETA